MAKLVAQFTTRAYNVGGYEGYFPSLVSKGTVADESFLAEVISRAGLNYTPEELLHVFRAVAKYGPILAAEDGRSRMVTGFIEFRLLLKGGMESPDAPWDKAKNKCIVAAKLRWEAVREVTDLSLTNVNSGISVRLNNVTYLGAQQVQNVIKAGEPFAAYGNHMEMIAGDTAKLIYQQGAIKREVALDCSTSDVSKAEFAFPQELAGLEAGTQLVFEMRSRGGIEAGQAYVNRKQVTLLAYTGDNPLVASVQDGTLEPNTVTFGDATVTIKGAGLAKATTVKFGTIADGRFDKSANGSALAHDGDNTLTCKFASNSSGMTDEELLAASAAGNLYLAALGPNGFANPLPVKYVVSA